MDEDVKLLPLAKADGREFLVDVKNREFREYDRPKNVIKMHSEAGRELLEGMQGSEWKSAGISTGRQDGMEV